MAISTYAQYKQDLAETSQQLPLALGSTASASGRWYNLWKTAVPIGTTPTGPVVPTNATLGSLGQQDSTSGTLAIIGSRFNSFNPGVYLVADRLSHQGGLSGTVATAQTTNLPTAALTRYTSGAGVMVGLSIYTQIGTTQTSVTISYTNQAGTSGQVSPAVLFGGTGFREANRFILIPLASDDTGVRAVASVTQLASTATAGAYGVTLFKPLYAVIVDETNGVTVSDFITGKSFGGIPEVQDGACLFMIAMSNSTAIQGGGILLLEEH